MFYNLADTKFIPTMIIVKDIYNKKIKINDIYKMNKIIHSEKIKKVNNPAFTGRVCR